MKDDIFTDQWRQCEESLRSCRCPMDSTALKGAVRKALWDERPRTNEDLIMKDRRFPLPYVLAAAACLAAVLVPLTMHSASRDGIRTVSCDGQQIVFACNDGCSVDNTIQSLTDFINLQK